MKEVWKTVPSCPFYLASSLGRIKRNGKFLSPQTQNGGYLVVHLWLNNERKVRTVHSLIAETFIGIRPIGKDVCHNNGKRTDNKFQNLRYATRKENFKDRIKHGTIYHSNTGGKLKPNQIFKIRRLAKTLSQKEIAARFKVSKEAIRRILRGDTWKYL